MIEILPPPCFRSFPLFPNYSTSLPIQEMLYELLGTPRERTWALGVRFGHQTLRKQRSIMTNLVVIPGGVPGLLLGCFWAVSGLLLGCLGSLRALGLLLAASRPLLWPVCWNQENHENDVQLDQLDGSNLSHSEFSGTQGGFGELELCTKYARG